jgi:aquaporin NIP
MKKYLAEFAATFALVFCGTGAIILDQHTGGTVGNMGIALAFGGIVSLMIYTVGTISGAHMNPAVTIGFWSVRLFNSRKVVPYISVQCAGAVAASGCLRYLFPGNATLGATLPSGTDLQAFLIEVFLMAVLMLVVLYTGHASKRLQLLSGLCIGGVVFLEAYFAGPLTGASMNPARSLAPALVSGVTSSLWVYIFAPLTGALIAAATWKRFFTP